MGCLHIPSSGELGKTIERHQMKKAIFFLRPRRSTSPTVDTSSSRTLILTRTTLGLDSFFALPIRDDEIGDLSIAIYEQRGQYGHILQRQAEFALGHNKCLSFDAPSGHQKF